MRPFLSVGNNSLQDTNASVCSCGRHKTSRKRRVIVNNIMIRSITRWWNTPDWRWLWATPEKSLVLRFVIFFSFGLLKRLSFFTMQITSRTISHFWRLSEYHANKSFSTKECCQECIWLLNNSMVCIAKIRGCQSPRLTPVEKTTLKKCIRLGIWLEKIR
jgi:hypothetical protein